MKKIAALIAALTTATAFGAVVAPSPANAEGTPGCVQLVEWNQVDIGDRRTYVHKVFETSGNVWAGGDGYETRVYHRCAGAGDDRVYVSYVQRDGVYRVEGKVWTL